LVVALIGAGNAAAIGHAAGPVVRPATRFGTITAQPPKLADVNALLARQADALVAGDRAGFLRDVDPSATDAYQGLYNNLVGLHVAEWVPRAIPDPTPADPGQFDVLVQYCLFARACQRVGGDFLVSAANRDGRTVLVNYAPPRPDDAQPYPWEADRLTFVTGPRVVVAATDDEADELGLALPAAEAAAAAADTYARWGKPADYVVYLASHRDAAKWFAGVGDDVLGEEVPLSPDDLEIMIIMPDATEAGSRGPGLQAVIQHEMGHVATLYGTDGGDSSDSLTEGIAEYIAYAQHPQWADFRIRDVGTYVRDGDWSGHCYLTDEIDSNDSLEASAAYGIGYLTIRRLVARFGLARTLDFWGRVERDGDGLDSSARAALGVSWASAQADCAAYIRTTVNS
jgi:hypothetical protein